LQSNCKVVARNYDAIVSKCEAFSKWLRTNDLKVIQKLFRRDFKALTPRMQS
jgi:hypothetical protein